MSGPGTVRWQRWGGGGLLAAAVLQGLGLLGYVLTSTRMPGLASTLADGFWLLAATALLLAMFPLALGTGKSDGIVGSSVSGKTALIGFGGFTLLSRITTLGFFFIGFPQAGSITTTVDVFESVAAISGIVASVIIVRAGVVTGFARWTLLAAVSAAVLAGLLTGLSGPLSWALAAVALAALALAGLSYLRYRGRFEPVARGTGENLAE